MRAKPIILAAVIMALAIPSAASASSFISKSTAEHATRVIVHSKYGDWNVGVACRPYARSEAVPGFIYRRFVCAWAADAQFTDGSAANCSGTLGIAGSHVYQYQWFVVSGERCT